MTKKIIISLIILSLLLTSFALGDQSIKITDLDNHWAKGLITNLIKSQVISGYDNGTFKPDNTIKVGEFTKILITAMGYKIDNNTKGHWAQNYIAKAKELNIIVESEFKPKDYDRNITRGEISRMIVRAIKEEYPDNMREYAGQIEDYKAIPDSFKDYILKAYVKGIISGYEDETVRYNSPATRAEAVAFISRMLYKEQRQVPDLIYTDKIVIDGKEIPVQVKEIIKPFNKIANIKDAGITEVFAPPYKNADMGICFYANQEAIENYNPYLSFYTNPKPASGNVQYIIYIKNDDKKTLKVAKEVLKTLLPTQYEKALDTLFNMKERSNINEKGKEYTMDNRRVMLLRDPDVYTIHLSPKGVKNFIDMGRYDK